MRKGIFIASLILIAGCTSTGAPLTPEQLSIRLAQDRLCALAIQAVVSDLNSQSTGQVVSQVLEAPETEQLDIIAACLGSTSNVTATTSGLIARIKALKGE